MQIDDTTSGGWVRRWTLVAGFPVCVQDALPPGDADGLAAYQRNAAVRTLVDAVDAYEAADAATQAAATDLTKAHALWRTPEPAADDPAHAAWADSSAVVMAALDVAAIQALPTDPRPVPSQVPMWAAQAALKQAGHYDAINAAVLSMETSNAPVFFAWTMGNFASRTSVFIATLAASFGMTEADIDSIFRTADQISAVAG